MNVTWLKLLAKDLLRHAGLELRRLKYVNSEETVLTHILAARNPSTVLDVGANTGQYARLLRKIGYRGSIVSFEAIPAVHAKLGQLSTDDPRWTIAPCTALGSRRGAAEIHLAKNSVSSSLLPMHETHLEAAPESVYVGRQTIRMERLDELAGPFLSGEGELMLKIDTQGYEKEVLLGASALIPSIGVLQVEMSLATLYEGAPGMTEMISFIEKLGYELFSIVPGLRNLESGRLLQADGFFLRPAKNGM